jgi:predicted phage-related endonuclease
MSQNEIAAKLRELRELQALIEQAEAETIKDALKAHMDAQNVEEISADVYKVRYTTVQGTRLDTAALKKDAPGIYEQYTRKITTRRFTFA